ncbi:MAG: hypothetical protein KBT00_04245 [Bacteroidales bacterium]|nr:hypothetical protein [Candidatus Cacconaster merdequi]
MKRKFISFFILAAALSIASASAQSDPREPGLYAVNGEESVPMTTVSAAKHSTSIGFGGVEIQKNKLEYKGVTSGTKATGKFVLVCDMEKKAIKQTFKKYDVFVQSMTPDNIIIIPLTVEKKKRVYDVGTSLNGINTERKERVDFTWEQISDNSYQIEAEMEPGEYAIVFRFARLDTFNFNTVFDFTVEAADGTLADTDTAE